MNHRRLVGIDLGIASGAHTVRVLDGEGNTVAKRKAWPTLDCLGQVEAAALAGCPSGTRLEVVVGVAFCAMCVSLGAAYGQPLRERSMIQPGAPLPVTNGSTRERKSLSAGCNTLASSIAVGDDGDGGREGRSGSGDG